MEPVGETPIDEPFKPDWMNYRQGFLDGAAEERELILQEWTDCLFSDLEHGVKSLNEAAAKKFEKEYPAIYGFYEFLVSRGTD